MEEQITGTDVNQIDITSLNHINGQPQVQEVLRVSIDAYFQSRANNTDSSFGPAILLGPSGTGKTLTAKAIHCELANLTLIETNGEMLNSALELAGILLTADENTTVFIDELFDVSRSGTCWPLELEESFKQFPACRKLLEIRGFGSIIGLLCP